MGRRIVRAANDEGNRRPSRRLLVGGSLVVLVVVPALWFPRTLDEDGGPPREALAPVASPPPNASEDTPPLGDPDALAAWYEARVRAALDGEPPEGRTARGRSSPVPSEEHPDAADIAPRERPGPGVGFAGSAARVGTPAGRPQIRSAAEAPPELAEDPDIDWAYLEQVWSGEISGIPDEGRAGLDLQQIDALNPIPYVEELRSNGEYAELRDLGFEDEVPGWPECMRLGRCRVDHESSPP